MGLGMTDNDDTDDDDTDDNDTDDDTDDDASSTRAKKGLRKTLEEKSTEGLIK